MDVVSLFFLIIFLLSWSMGWVILLLWFDFINEIICCVSLQLVAAVFGSIPELDCSRCLLKKDGLSHCTDHGKFIVSQCACGLWMELRVGRIYNKATCTGSNRCV
ncbi:hypothetical protein BJ508DRAFT_129521 [Ascobolus immersus RN42]|uniref:Uncharacterized protein n=1 Tax=Ascobolus immersus RN42 TaxID=1160509 RepID=A0A3N4I2V3_ASCIM|nr:hypothetical protein BJ508DRAFT_129521 [Ascobolus immersus RN42]